MPPSENMLVQKILGSKLSADGKTVEIDVATDAGAYSLTLSSDVLNVLALTALKARTELEAKAAELRRPNTTHAFPCDKWEIHGSNDGKFLLFGFRHFSGAWLRIQAPKEIATPMREVLEIVEGRSATPPIPRSRN